MARKQVAAVCFGLLIVSLASCSKIGALRLVDLSLMLAVMSIAYVLALRDSRHLPVLVFGTWLISPFVRRIVDWQLGGFESLTALSLLPMLATTVLAIPTFPRLRQLPWETRQPLLFVVLPVAIAAAEGLAWYGPSAALDAGTWLMPMLFLPYFATRQFLPNEREAILRSAVVLAAVSAAYGWYQFIVLPSWDRLWLVQSGMTSSMGSANPLSVRVWGTMNACGPAAAIWAGATVIALCDRKWRSPIRILSVVAVTTALLLTRVRICWIMATAGLLVWSVLSGKRNPGTVLGTVVVITALLIIAPQLPGGDLVSDRLSSFEDLENDNSFRSRRNFALQLIDQISTNPLGVGLGYKTAGKVAGSSGKLVAFDNGVGEVLYALGIPGGAMWFLGMAMLVAALLRRAAQSYDSASSTAKLALAVFAMHCLGLMSTFSFAGVSGLMPWMIAGVSLAGTSVRYSGVEHCQQSHAQSQI